MNSADPLTLIYWISCWEKNTSKILNLPCTNFQFISCWFYLFFFLLCHQNTITLCAKMKQLIEFLIALVTNSGLGFIWYLSLAKFTSYTQNTLKCLLAVSSSSITSHSCHTSHKSIHLSARIKHVSLEKVWWHMSLSLHCLNWLYKSSFGTVHG